MILQVTKNASAFTYSPIYDSGLLDKGQRFSSLLMNALFPPGNIMMTSERNQSSSTTLNDSIEIQLFHFVLVGLALVMPPLFHSLGQCRQSVNDVCSSFVISITSGCFVSFLCDVRSLVMALYATRESDLLQICSSHIFTDKSILICLVLAVTIHCMTNSKKTLISYKMAVVILWLWFITAISGQVHTFITQAGTYCSSNSYPVHKDVHVNMPVVRIVQSSWILVAMDAILYLPPALIIICSDALWKNNMSQQDIMSISSKVKISARRPCPICARTSRLFRMSWWRTVICLLLGVVRPCWIMGTWYYGNNITDFPPLVTILTIFYPVCIAQTISCIRFIMLGQPINVVHL